jgi:hypothetical protein
LGSSRPESGFRILSGKTSVNTGNSESSENRGYNSDVYVDRSTPLRAGPAAGGGS